MKKCLIALVWALILALPSDCAAAAEESISAKAAIVYEPRSATVLYEKCADERLLIASTTKIMTAMVVIENCEGGEKVAVSRAHSDTEGSSMYLRPGGDYSVEELLYGLMLASGNDAAAALADHTAGSMEAFAGLMNAKARELGLENSHFVNAHGLDAEGHYSSARDLALITAAAMESERFREIFSTEHRRVAGVDYYNHNRLLGSCPGCIGGKTGYTEKAGRSLVSCVEREGMRLICVTISAPRDWEDHEKLYDRLFGEYRFLAPGEESLRLPLASGDGGTAPLSCPKGGFVAPKEGESLLRLHLPRFVFSTPAEGERAGRAELIVDGQSAGEADIFFSGGGKETDNNAAAMPRGGQEA